MAALTQDRNTRIKKELYLQSYLLAADAVIFSGGLVARDAAGHSDAAADAAGVIVQGVAKVARDNTGGAAGDLEVKVGKGVYEFDNAAAGAALTQADVDLLCYLVDDQTVGNSTGAANNIIAGKFLGFSDVSGKVWVEVGLITLDADIAS